MSWSNGVWLQRRREDAYHLTSIMVKTVPSHHERPEHNSARSHGMAGCRQWTTLQLGKPQDAWIVDAGGLHRAIWSRSPLYLAKQMQGSKSSATTHSVHEAADYRSGDSAAGGTVASKHGHLPRTSRTRRCQQITSYVVRVGRRTSS